MTVLADCSAMTKDTRRQHHNMQHVFTMIGIQFIHNLLTFPGAVRA